MHADIAVHRRMYVGCMYICMYVCIFVIKCMFDVHIYDVDMLYICICCMQPELVNNAAKTTLVAEAAHIILEECIISTYHDQSPTPSKRPAWHLEGWP